MTGTLTLEVDVATLDRIAELDMKTDHDVEMELAFAVEDLVQEKHQELRKAEAKQGQPVPDSPVPDEVTNEQD